MQLKLKEMYLFLLVSGHKSIYWQTIGKRVTTSLTKCRLHLHEAILHDKTTNTKAVGGMTLVIITDGQ